MSSSVARDQVLSAGVNGMCRSQRSPPFTVKVGLTRQESWTNAEPLLWRDFLARSPL